MIFQHLTVWLWNVEKLPFFALYAKHPVIMSLNSTGGLSAAIFVICSAFGYALFFKTIERDILCVKRGIYILILGYFLNIIIPSWFSIGSWYVLHIIGFGIILIPYISRLPVTVIFIIYFAVIIVSVLGQIFLKTPYFIYNERMGDYNMQYGFLRLILFEGHFPIFPWLAVFFHGVLLAKVYMSEKYLLMRNIGIIYILSGLFLGMLFVINILPAEFSIYRRFFFIKSGFYPAHPPIVLILSGLITMLIFAAITIKDISRTNPIVCLGKNSLTVFILHILIFREFFIRIGIHQTFSETMSVLIMSAAILTFSVISFFWEKNGFKYSFEWFMRKLK